MEFVPALLQTHKSLEVETVSELSKLPVLWALPNLLPCHRLSLIVAPSGTGLTHLACRLAAAQTALCAPVEKDPAGDASAIPQDLDTSGFAPEDLLPDPNDPDWDPMLPLVPHRTPAPAEPPIPSTLLITFRDDPDVLRPRLLAAGAHPDEVLLLSRVYEKAEQGSDTYARCFTPEDTSLLSSLLHQHKSIRLVLIDNAQLLFTATNRPAKAKLERQLQAFLEVARRREVAIVFLAAIPHLCANPFRSTVLSTLQEACRLVYLLAPDPQRPDHRYLFALKNTLADPVPHLELLPPPPGSAPRGAGLQPASPTPSSAQTVPALCASVPSPTSSVPSPLGEGQGGGIPRPDAETASLLHARPTSLTYPAYLEERSAPRQRGPVPYARLLAEQFLTQVLASGAPIPVGHEHHPEPDSLRAQARAAGLSWGTVRRAMTHLHLHALRQENRWFWQLAQPAASENPKRALPAETCAPCPDLTTDKGQLTNDDPLTCASCPPPLAQPSPVPLGAAA